MKCAADVESEHECEQSKRGRYAPEHSPLVPLATIAIFWWGLHEGVRAGRYSVLEFPELMECERDKVGGRYILMNKLRPS